MEWLPGFGIVVGMSLLRLVIPVAIMAAGIYIIRRLDIRLHPTVHR
jgi:hypothetical protein